MNRIFYTLIIFLIPINSYGQLLDTIYYDKEWNETTSIDWKYYRTYSLDSLNNWIIATEYFRNGNVQMRGNYVSTKAKKRIGEFVWFYENGQEKEKCNYVKNKKSGLSTRWFNNGNLDCSGPYLKGKNHGKWTYYHNDNNKRSAEIEYYKGKKRTEKYWNLDGSNLNDKEMAYTMPEYPGGMDEFRLKVGRNLNYPDNLESKGIEGRVIISFIVDSEGNMKDIEVFQSGYPEFDNEARRVFDLAVAQWKPGKNQNRYSDFQFFFPVAFKGTSNKKLIEKGYSL